MNVKFSLKQLLRGSIKSRMLLQGILIVASFATLAGLKFTDIDKVQYLAVLAVLSAINVGMLYLFAHDLTRRAHMLTDKMQEMCNKRDLSVRVEVEGNDELTIVSNIFNKMLSEFHTILSAIRTSSIELSTSAEELAAITMQTSQGVIAQNSETDQVATAMNEMAATAQEVARNASQAAASAHTANETSQTSAEVAVNAMCGMDNLVSEVEKAANVIKQLEKESDNIGVVLDVIKGIAEQTNLLALNAAIEAARAGEQGRGFAVVADEVRALAGKTQKSTEEIHSMIDRLQKGARQAVTVMIEAEGLGKSGSQQTEAAAEALAEIAGEISTINDMNTQIASAAEEQTAVAEEINRSITNIARVAQETAAGAERTTDLSNALADIASALTSKVSGFRL